jgi:hypothetical protein
MEDKSSSRFHEWLPLVPNLSHIQLQPCETFRKKLPFYGQELLAPCPSPKLWSTTRCRLLAGPFI